MTHDQSNDEENCRMEKILADCKETDFVLDLVQVCLKIC